MPDRYEFRRYADNLTHPWFEGVRSDFKSLCKSPNRLLLCILCIILMNLDESIYFEYFGPGSGSDYESEHDNHRKLQIKHSLIQIRSLYTMRMN